jgi:hypothetical protein
MFAFLILLLQQVMAILGFKGNKNKANHNNPKPEPGLDLEPGLLLGLRHRAPFTVEIHQFR